MIEASTQFMVGKPINRIWQVQQFQSGRDFRKRQVVENGIYYLEREETPPRGTPKYELWFLDLKTGKQSFVAPIDKRPYSSGLALSPDRRWFLYTQIDASDTDIMLVEDFR